LRRYNAEEDNSNYPPFSRPPQHEPGQFAWLVRAWHATDTDILKYTTPVGGWIPLFTTLLFCSPQNTVQLMTAGMVRAVTNRVTPPGSDAATLRPG
jgi:hypothetical protein